jgi:hypothetical protein
MSTAHYKRDEYVYSVNGMIDNDNISFMIFSLHIHYPGSLERMAVLELVFLKLMKAVGF